MKVWCNGKIIEEEAATISIFDRSYLYGEGVFETLKSYSGKAALADRHFKRLQSNCRRLQIPLELSQEKFEQTLNHLLKENQLKEAAVRITMSLVGATFGVGRPEKSQTNINIFCRPILIDPKLYETGVRVLPLNSLVNDSPAIAGIKSTSYLTKMIARAEADKAGAYEAILKNVEGFWVEGSRTNLFIVLDKTVITPPLRDGILPGITREVVLEILNEKKIPHREDHLTDLMLQNAEEIFLTGSTSEVMPVCEITGLWKKEPASKETALFLLQEYRKNVLKCNPFKKFPIPMGVKLAPYPL